ncbi:hypothetical protein [Pseudomonas sp. BBP2017]|uniref:hypothetical protein n=1 Tax=Pseudomonas sp. BBP2017 TaxID=2109731 RepID=UPI000D12ABD6|nr:hypothetical protein [Pseudomonas sp. BBP2017]PSS58301.1 hypothetical protein C6382_02840 [Pseudomonas sp. BBP2017]
MNIIEFAFFVLLSAAVSLLLNRYPIKPQFIPWGMFVSLIYNALMIAFYLDAVENKNLLFFQFGPSTVEYHPAITIVSMIMVLFHWRAIRTKE